MFKIPLVFVMTTAGIAVVTLLLAISVGGIAIAGLKEAYNMCRSK